MTSLVLEALPVAIALTALGVVAFVVAFVIPGLLALDLFFNRPDKSSPRRCSGRAHDRGADPR